MTKETGLIRLPVETMEKLRTWNESEKAARAVTAAIDAAATAKVNLVNEFKAKFAKEKLPDGRLIGSLDGNRLDFKKEGSDVKLVQLHKPRGERRGGSKIERVDWNP